MQKPDSQEKNKGRRPEAKPSPPPLNNIIFWLIILTIVPVAILLVQNSEKKQEMIESDFKQNLRAQKIISAKKVEDRSGVVTISGEWLPKSGAKPEKYTTKVFYTNEMDRLISENVKKYEAIPANTFWSNLLIPLIPILILVALIYYIFTRQIRNAGKGAIQFGKSRAKMVQSLDKVTFTDVAGVEEAKEEVEEIIEYLKDPDRFHRLGGRMPTGVLMVGPPGTGKTLLAKAIAGEADVPFFNISGSDFVEMFVGVGASRVRDMFEQGKKHAPCIIFIDEIDAVGRSRFSGIGGGHDEREQTLNALLVEMDGFEGNSGVIVIAATNRPDVLDPALLRPGRFDRQITLDLPDLNGRLEILNVHVKKVKLSDQVDLAVVARGTPGFSGADLANLVNEAALLAARRGKNAVEQPELEEARDKVRWGKERRSRVMDKHDKEVTAYHEAGHALVSLHCENATPLHKVTIIPRGMAFLGAAMYLPEKDKYTTNRSELADELAILMAGRTAEELIFNEITSGAAMDIKQATSIVRKMVCEWGMSEKLGMMRYGEREEHIYVGRDITRNIDYSEETAREIDSEIRRIIDAANARAHAILTEHRDQLEKLGKALLERETIDVKEIRKLLDIPAPEREEVEKPSETEGESPEATTGAEETANAGDKVTPPPRPAGMEPEEEPGPPPPRAEPEPGSTA